MRTAERRRLGGGLAFCLAAMLALAACSGSFSFGTSSDQGFIDAGEELIEGELAEQIDLGPLDATCSGEDLTAGDTFECTATPGDLNPIRFVGTINDDEDGVNISSTNLMLAAQVEEVEAFAASLIEQQTSTPIGAENFECANTSLIITDGEVMDCRVTDPADGTVYDAAVTIDSLADLSITVNVGDPIG